MKALLVYDNREITKLCLSICNVEAIWNIRYLIMVKKHWTFIKNKRFDLILFDLATPEFSGPDILMELDEHELLRSKIL
jgi:DNA-binding NtrC family response regulator